MLEVAGVVRRASGVILPLALVLVLGGETSARAQRPRASEGPPAAPAVTVSGDVALASLVALSDGELVKMADLLEVLAASDAARSADWRRIGGPLGDVGRRAVPAVLWFALPTGAYWTVHGGRASESLASRAYFPRLMAGRRVIGALVVSKSTGRSTAVVAVPIRDSAGTIVGALGSSIYLDSLSLRLARAMRLPDDVIFFAIDSTPIGALNRDPGLIFSAPLTLGADLRRAIERMLRADEGVVSYTFRDARRTVLYRKSPVTGWWYALGVVRREASAAKP